MCDIIQYYKGKGIMENKKSLKEKIENIYEMNLKDIGILLLAVMVCSAIFGFIYEELFYRIDLGVFVKRGTTLGPWIPIYGFGGLLIALFAYKLKHDPFYVFFLSSLLSGVVEFGTGYVLDKFFSTRLWDYNIEIWNWGNIGGYICARSVIFFGLSGLFLVYFLIPTLKKLKQKITEKFGIKAYNIPVIVISTIYVADFIFSEFISKFIK